MRPRPLAADTSPDAAAVQIAQWRAMSPAEKLEAVRALTSAVLRLEGAGQELRAGSALASDGFRQSAERRLGPVLAAQAYGAPADR